MKRFITTVFLGLGLCQAAWGSLTTTNQFVNYGLITSSPEVDAVGFYNAGTIEINAVVGATPTNLTSGLFENGYNPLPFTTKDTLYYTNTQSGVLLAYPGFLFDTVTSTTTHGASYFLNQGTVEGIDVQAYAADALYEPPGSLLITTIPGMGQPIPSQVLVQATNIVNSGGGAISVGNAGVLSLVGSNVTTAYGTLAAGAVSTVGNTSLTIGALTNNNVDTTGLQGQDGGAIFVGGPYFYVPSTGVYDLFWGITNALTEDVSILSGDLENLATDSPEYFVPSINTTARGDSLAPGFFPINYISAQWSVTATYNIDGTGTNIYYNIVFVNTNFSNPNMSATVGIGNGVDFLQYASATVPEDDNAFEDIVQIAEPVYDVITGQTVTNGIYLIDDGALLPSMTECLDASDAGPYYRPNAFALTTTTPIEWADAVLLAEAYAFPYGYDPAYIYTAGTFNNYKEPLEISEYGAQIGRNPSDYSGSFTSLLETNSAVYDYLSDFKVNLPDPTNDPARIEISADNLDITQARVRAEGMVIYNVTNLTGGGTAAVDFGQVNATVNATNGVLNVSNFFPTTFSRVRGDIYAWSATWQNTMTNDFGTGPITNQWHYHVLVVDQNLFGSFAPTVRNLTLTGKKTIVLQDNLNVINQAVFNTTNLTIESSNYFSQNAQNFTPATTPYLQNLFINTNGFLGSYNLLDVGFNANRGPAAPQGRAYTVNSITNLGQMISIAPLFQSRLFENDGSVTANNRGSILIEASNLSMGLVLTSTTNYLLADGSVSLSANTIQVTNSVISAGLAEPASLTLNATAQLTDLVSGAPTTNTNSVIINHWTVTDGFTLESKPATGDLFGTEIHTIATNVQYVTHVWAATDWSNNVAKGFSDNEVIGRLVLDRQSSNSILHFSAAGKKNAMYVDYLDLTNYASTNYYTNLLIDPNFTIYFADSNIDPGKLQQHYTNLIWVRNFVGPNSVQAVPYTNSSIVCLMNAAVANSTEIAFWDGILNYYFLKDYGPYLLNGPYGTNFMSCPGTYSFPCNCTPGSNGFQLAYTNVYVAQGSNLEVLTISSNGQGTITSSPVIQQSTLAPGKAYTLTAKPATGWVFDYWTTAIEGGATNTNSYSPKLTFAFVTNTAITANFIPNPFPASAGVYYGLFFESNAVDPASSGAVSLTLAKTGSFSGKLVMGPASYPFASQFTGSGAAGFQARSGNDSLWVNLQLDITNDSGQITGQVLGQTDGVAWDAFLTADVAPAWTAKNPSPLEGSYTMSLPWETGIDTNDMAGDSFGAGAVSKLGVLTLAGALADGTTFSASAPVSQNGYWPFYAYAAAGKDSVLGWVTVSNGLSGTNISWSKAAGKRAHYPDGFTNLLPLTGSSWQAPKKGAAALNLTDPIVVLSGGVLSTNTLSIPVKLESLLTFGATNLNLTVKSASGVFSGWFDSPGTRKKVTFSGVVLTDEGIARGFFPGTNESGAVLLEGP
jgi:hypothetical protein